MKWIQLTQGKVALVDDRDFPRVSQYKWYARKTARHMWYAQRNSSSPNGKRRTELMHRFILMLGADDPLVDHRDGNPLNNRRNNLRLATKGGNASNIRVRKDSVSGFKGVRFDKRRRKWSAQIGTKGKFIWLGYWDDPVSAAHAYDNAARKFHGEFARCNFS